MKNEQNALFSVYGARISKNGNRVNISLISGKDEDKKYACISIQKDSENIMIKEDKKGQKFVYLKIKFLQEFEDSKKKNKKVGKKEVDEDVEDVDALPF